MAYMVTHSRPFAHYPLSNSSLAHWRTIRVQLTPNQFIQILCKFRDTLLGQQSVDFFE